VIVKDEQRVVMQFIATANRGGYRPTGREVNEWRLRPDPRPRRRGKLLEAAVPEIPERRVRKGPSRLGALYAAGALADLKRNQAFANSALRAFGKNYMSTIKPTLDALGTGYLGTLRSLGLQAEYEIIPGRPGRPARYAPDKPAEKFLGHLRRLNWIERDQRGRYGGTQLGHALLRAEAAADEDDEDTSVMVLTAEDELAYGRVLGVISECGEAMIVDAYLGAQELVHILKDSSASRFLVSSKLSRSRLTELALMIRLTPPTDGVVRELRCADFHDRYVIGEIKVYGLGSSLNGVGKSMTTLVQMPDTAAQTIRAEAESLWAAAEVIAYTDEHIQVDDDLDQGGRRPHPRHPLWRRGLSTRRMRRAAPIAASSRELSRGFKRTDRWRFS
jgi:hypothetical protein